MSKLPDGAHFQIRNKMGTTPTPPPPKICGNDQYKSKSGKCENCTVCKADEIIKVKCTKTSDTICEKKPPKPPGPPGPPPRFNIFTIIIVVICIAVLVGLYFAFYKKRI